MAGKIVRWIRDGGLMAAAGWMVLGCSARRAQAQQVAATTSEARALGTQRVTVDVDDVPLVTALQTIARQAGLSPVYKESILPSRLRVTVHVRQVPVRDAFGIALRGTGLIADIQSTGDVAFIRGGLVTADSVVTGRVIDGRTRQPVRGATVTLDETAQATRTDHDGTYRFVGVGPGLHRIRVRVLGYGQQTKPISVTLDTAAHADFALVATSVNTLDQVVVTATGAQQYRELGHVVTKLNADSLVKNAPITTFAQLLTARVPGLEVMPGNGGVAGGEVAMRLRGQTTLNLDPQPIIILDGVRYRNTNGVPDNTFGEIVEDQRAFNVAQRSPLNDINVNDIESVEIVKGPSASTLYGPDAANGVIIITTKKGQAGKPKWNFYVHPNLATLSHDGNVPQRGYWGWGHDPNTGLPFSQSCTLIDQYEYNECVLDSITVAPVAASDPNLSVIEHDRPQWQSGLNVSGGADALRYFVSAGYDSQSGSIRLPPATATYLREQLGDDAVNNALKNPNSQQTATLRSNLAVDVTPKLTVSLDAGYTQATQQNIDLGVFTGTLTAGVLMPGCDPTDPTGVSCDLNNYSDAYLSSATMSSNRMTGTATGTYHPMDWLVVNGSLGTDIQQTTDRGVIPSGDLSALSGGSSTASDYRHTNINRTGSLHATARARVGRYSFQSTLGTDYNYSHLDGLDAQGFNLAPGSMSISTASQQQSSLVWNETVSLGTFGEEVVGINDRLYLTASLRYDGSTSFGDAYHPRPFPKLGASWVVSEEPFLRNVPGLDQLRLRYSYGASSRYPTSIMKDGSIGSSQFSYNGNTATTYSRSLLANPVIQPERSRESEYGLDATLFSRIDVELTWYNRHTDDQLLLFSYPQGLGPQWGNLGDVSSRGAEATITAHLFETNTFRGTIRFTSSFNTNKLLNAGPSISPTGGIVDGYRVGYPLNSIFDRVITGVDDTVGNRRDSVVFANEIVYNGPTAEYVGVLVPPHTYTMTPTLDIWGGRVRLSTLIDRSTGFVIPAPTLSGGLSLASLEKTAPLLAQAQTLVNCCVYQSGDYTRWREFTLSLDLPQRLVHLATLSRGTVSLNVRNLALWTRYKNGDPESIPGEGTVASQSVSYPYTGIAQPRSWSISFDFIP